MPDCSTKKSKTIRSLDGSCNNLGEPNFGRALTPFQRVSDAEYAPRTVFGPRVSKNGNDLPSARLISTTGKFNEHGKHKIMTTPTQWTLKKIENTYNDVSQGERAYIRGLEYILFVILLCSLATLAWIWSI